MKTDEKYRIHPGKVRRIFQYSPHSGEILTGTRRQRRPTRDIYWPRLSGGFLEGVICRGTIWHVCECFNVFERRRLSVLALVCCFLDVEGPAIRDHILLASTDLADLIWPSNLGSPEGHGRREFLIGNDIFVICLKNRSRQNEWRSRCGSRFPEHQIKKSKENSCARIPS